jgi:hypothetical protein
MKLQATIVLFMVTAVAHAQRRALCAWCRQAYGSPCPPDQMTELNLSPTGPCGRVFSSKPDCPNIVPKTNLICPKCAAVFITNSDPPKKKVPQLCHHPSVKIYRQGTGSAATRPVPGPSEPGPSQPETTEDGEQDL